MIISPLRATCKRWLKLATSKYSVLRSLEYERLNGLIIKGDTLDVGGGKNNSYYHLVKIEGAIYSINIDVKIKPSVVTDLNNAFPFVDSCFDNIVCLNTLEHIINDTQVIREIVRVLKPGGGFHIMVPFLYRVHASPNDYHRHTAKWWECFFASLGINPENVTVEPLVWDPVTSAFSLAEFKIGRLRSICKMISMFVSVLSHVRYSGSQRLPNTTAQNYAAYALGYYIHGAK